MPITADALEQRIIALEARCGRIENDVLLIAREVGNLETALRQSGIADIPAMKNALRNLDERLRRLGG